VALVSLLVGLANVGRAAVAFQYAARLPDLPLSVSWSYLVASGGVWGIAFLACTVGLMRFRPWGRWGTLVAAPLYQAHVWLDRLLFDRSDYAHLTRPRDVVLTVLFLGLVWGVLNLRAVRCLFE
jgi:hypothetical protein